MGTNDNQIKSAAGVINPPLDGATIETLLVYGERLFLDNEILELLQFLQTWIQWLRRSSAVLGKRNLDTFERRRLKYTFGHA